MNTCKPQPVAPAPSPTSFSHHLRRHMNLQAVWFFPACASTRSVSQDVSQNAFIKMNASLTPTRAPRGSDTGRCRDLWRAPGRAGRIRARANPARAAPSRFPSPLSPSSASARGRAAILGGLSLSHTALCSSIAGRAGGS